MNSPTSSNPFAHFLDLSVKPAALPVDLACKYIGCGRSTLYILLTQGAVKSVVHKTHKGNVRGRRVFLRESLDSYLKSLEEEGAPVEIGNRAGVSALTESGGGR
jgi:hypothetical protein